MYVKRVAGAAFAAALGMSGLAVGAGVSDAAPLKPAPTYTGFGPIADAPPGPGPGGPGPGPGPGPGGPGPGGPGGSGGAHGPGGPGGPGARLGLAVLVVLVLVDRGIGWSSWAWWPGGPGAGLRLVGRAVPVELDLAVLVARWAWRSRWPWSRWTWRPGGPGRHGPGGPGGPSTGRAGPADRVELMSLVDRADLADLAVLGAPAVPNLTGRVDLAGRAAPVDRHRRRTSNTVSTTGVAPRWAAPGTCRTGSARRITGRRLRPGNTDSAGTVGLPPVLRRLSGTDHHLQVAGAGLRLPVVGTADGTGRRAMSQSRSVISGRLVTTGTTRSRCSTRYSVDGASGSSVSGSRCTDLTARSPD